MSKQVYIDSNGNEIQVSGTVNTADMMPMSGNDSTKVATAIGDLTTLTTTDKSSLVGAVNEVVDDIDALYVISKNSSVMSVNSTWQIPDTVLAKKLVILEAHRYGYGGSIILPTEFITAGAYTTGFTLGREGYPYTFSLSNTGLLTLINTGGSGDPSVCAIGIL